MPATGSIALPGSVKLALAIAGLAALYFAVGTLLGADDAPPEASTTGRGTATFKVATRSITAEPWRDEVRVRGRTQAIRKVLVRAEVFGAVAETPAAQGATVAEGDVLCRLKLGARGAALDEARASLKKAELDYQAAAQLAEEGFRSETGVAGAQAALDLARANLESASLGVAHTRVKAPFAGVFDERRVEIGDFMNAGDACGVLIQQDPFLVTGAVSEQDVAKIAVGDRGRAHLATGETLEGRVRFVSTAADPATRTFRIELEVPNTDGLLRDGVTADFVISTAERNAWRVPRSALTLDDDGRIGLRHVVDGNIVAFTPVALLGESPRGVLVSGLAGEVDVITRGQDFVAEGQTVEIEDESDAGGGGEPRDAS